jgi:hypothetical protein
MPVETRINIPFIPQEGITANILSAIQLANEHQRAQQQAMLGQQQLAQQAPLVQAQTGREEAETQAIPKRLDLEMKRIDAETELRKATLALEDKRWTGMRNLGQEKQNLNELKTAQDYEIKKLQAAWSAKLDAARIGGIVAQTQYRKDALAQLTQFHGQEIQLRQQAEDLAAKGEQDKAAQVNAQADHIANESGFMRTLLGETGAMPEVKVPAAATKPTAATKPAVTPARPKGVPANATWDATTRTWNAP